MTEWKLFTSSRSPFVRKVIMAAHYTHVLDRIEKIEVATTPVTPSPEVMAQNPLGMIPTLLLADGEVLTGSDAILDYFNEIVPAAELIPQGGKLRRDVLRRQAIADGAMDKSVKWLDERFRVQNEDTRSHISGYSNAILAVADWFEARIELRAQPDAGDLALFCLLGYLEFRFPECHWRTGREKLVNWFEAMSLQPAAISSQPQDPPQ